MSEFHITSGLLEIFSDQQVISKIKEYDVIVSLENKIEISKGRFTRCDQVCAAPFKFLEY